MLPTKPRRRSAGCRAVNYGRGSPGRKDQIKRTQVRCERGGAGDWTRLRIDEARGADTRAGRNATATSAGETCCRAGGAISKASPSAATPLKQCRQSERCSEDGGAL